jgi:hypothetical protein
LRERSASKREEWECEQREAARGDGAPPYTPTGTEQELVGVIAGSSELLEGWRVLYGLLFADGISFACWREHDVNRRDDRELIGARDADAWEFDLREELGTDYGGGDAWGGEDGVQGVRFPAERSEKVPAWVELVSPAGNAIRLWL